MPEDFLSKRDNFDQWFAAFQKSISLATKTAIYKTKTKTTPRLTKMPSTDYAQYFGLSPTMIVACCTLTDTIRSGNSTLVLDAASPISSVPMPLKRAAHAQDHLQTDNFLLQSSIVPEGQRTV
jgi:hypothetical protein